MNKDKIEGKDAHRGHGEEEAGELLDDPALEAEGCDDKWPAACRRPPAPLGRRGHRSPQGGQGLDQA
jgi:hypothetical protein